MGSIGEFEEFAIKGNVLDMAVGIIIGAVFGSIFSLLVKDVIMPTVGMIMGGINFTDMFIVLDGNTYASPSSCSGSSRAHHQLWSVHKCHHQLPNSCTDHIHAHTPGKCSHEKAGPT